MLECANYTQPAGVGKVISLFPSPDSPAERPQNDPPAPFPFSLSLLAPSQRSPRRQPRAARATMQFRNTLVETDNAPEFRDGCQAGHTCAVDLLEAGVPLTSDMLATHLTQALLDDAPQAFNVGFVLSLVDTLCGPQKAAPHVVRRKRTAKKG